MIKKIVKSDVKEGQVIVKGDRISFNYRGKRFCQHSEFCVHSRTCMRTVADGKELFGEDAVLPLENSTPGCFVSWKGERVSDERSSEVEQNEVDGLK